MNRGVDRYEFASDNTASICPEAFTALEAANIGAAPSYGDDRWTARVCDLVREIFETDCDVYLVFNGTAANALARRPELHAHKPRAVSITQSTELGTVYTRDEIAAVIEFALRREMFVHMDGARFANAVASLDCAPKQITWQIGVDVLCFGGTKNGVAAGELVVFFEKELACEFDYRAKQAGQLASKMRFVAAPWLGLLTDGVWLKNAKHSNNLAQMLAEQLRAEAKIDIVFPVEANAVFLRMNEDLVRELHRRGWYFYKFIEPDVYRLMCSWSVSDRDIADFVADVVALKG